MKNTDCMLISIDRNYLDKLVSCNNGRLRQTRIREKSFG